MTNRKGFKNFKLILANFEKTLLQSVPNIPKRDNLLQSATGITKFNKKLLQSVTDITKCDNYYKVKHST